MTPRFHGGMAESEAERDMGYLGRVEQIGGACHNGYRSCFYTEFDRDGTTRIVAEKVFDPEDVYGKKG